MSKRRTNKSAVRANPTAPKARLNSLSLIIAATALAVIVLFIFPWLNAEEPLSGLDIASRNLQITENFPSGIVFILPLVVGSMLFQYYRRIWDTVRPRRREVTALMLLVGLIATGLWIRIYTIKATEFLNSETYVEVEDLPPAATPEEALPTKVYTTGEVLREQFTPELWLHVALSAALLVLPFIDPRPSAETPEI